MSPISQHAAAEDKNDPNEISRVNSKSLAEYPANLRLRMQHSPFARRIDKPAPTAIGADDKKNSHDYKNLIVHFTKSSSEKLSPIALKTVPINT
jgi:hypothetical protein